MFSKFTHDVKYGNIGVYPKAGGHTNNAVIPSEQAQTVLVVESATTAISLLAMN